MRLFHKVGIAGAGGGAIIAAAVAFIQPWEGTSTKPYFDSVGVLTICDGATAADGVDFTKKYTPAMCDDLLAKDLPKYDAGMTKCLKRPITDHMHVAFLSATYNIGVAGFCRSGMAQRVNAGDFKGACDALMQWVRGGGRVIQGLVNRRAAERKLCLEGL